jgi:hypothetical protein
MVFDIEVFKCSNQTFSKKHTHRIQSFNTFAAVIPQVRSHIESFISKDLLSPRSFQPIR